MPEFKKRLTLEATITANSAASADAIMDALRGKLAAQLPGVSVQDESELFGVSEGSLALADDRPVTVRGPRKKREKSANLAAA